MNTITMSQYVLRINRLSKIVENLAYNVLNNNRRRFHLAGAGIVMEEVYLNFPEGDYQRTGNLFGAFDTQVKRKENGAVLTLFIDPKDDLASYSGSGLYRYYPPYVVEGRFFGTEGKPRPFVKRWTKEVGEMVFEDVRDYVDRTVVKVMT